MEDHRERHVQNRCDLELSLSELVTLAKTYRKGWLRKKVSCEKLLVEHAKARAVSRFERCLEAHEDGGADVAGALKYLLDRVRAEELSTDWGLLETNLVCDAHRFLFRMSPFPKGMTPAGQLSEKPRCATDLRGNLHWYPVPMDMNVALTSLLDRYNGRYDACRGAYDFALFDTCSWLFCHFLALHPFADGNGRLCHILCSYAAMGHQPFPVAVCEEEDYLSALMLAQQTDDLGPLTVCVARSTCRAWQSFSHDVDCSTVPHDS